VQLPSHCEFPDSLDAVSFLKNYWQQSPLLMPQAFPDFQTPLPADELAGLSLEPGTSPRLIVRDDAGNFRLEHGPFEEQRFATLGRGDWSLLITDVEKHIPQLRGLLTAFSFLPSWRIDDVMISYAPDGSSVGAHVDEYDVFLLQASGQRQWLIEDTMREHVQSTQGDLRLVEDFKPNKDLLLSPGDMLYLPPGIAHHGIAVGDDCTTWSIGFRAQSTEELILKISELVAERLSASNKLLRYRDPPLSPAVCGELDADAITTFRSLWQTASDLNSEEFSNLLGTLLTQDGGINREDNEASISEVQGSGEEFDRHAFSELVWIGDGELVTLFADGDSYQCTRALAITLCGMQSPTLKSSEWTDDENDQHVIRQLVSAGVLIAST